MNNPSGNADIKLRLLALNILIFITIGIFIIHLFYLQIIKGLEFKERAKEVSLREIPIPAQRGMVYDTNYDIPLVYNIDSFAVYLIPGQVENDKLDALFEKLAEVLKVKKKDVQKKVPLKYYNHYQPIEIKSGVSFKTVSHIAEHIEDFPGVSWNSKPIRGYLDSGSISHIVGYVGDITTEELIVLYNKGYNYSSTLGKSGIEKQYDDLLRGRDGARYKIVDVKEKQLMRSVPDVVPPEQGKQLILTIDRKLQKLCEKALGDRIGSVVVLKPTTGEVLAMVSYPWFDPNMFYSEGGTELYSKVSLDPRYPFLNRSVQSVYPPASVFKTLMSVAFIEEGVFPITKTINCTGEMTLGDRTARCWKEFGHGKVDFFGGLEQSCNIYYYTVGVEYLKIDHIVRYARDFGLGIKTGIDLPEEVSGFLPTPEWKLATKNTPWFGGDTMNVSIGQGELTVTPLHLANMIAMIVNEGKIYKPHILKEVRDSITGGLITQVAPEVLHTNNASSETYRLVKQAMRQVVTKGTGYLINTKAVEVAGKTGTPETGVVDFYHSWFGSYAPYTTDNPDERIVVVAMIEASEGEQQWWASKTANIVFQGYFANQTFEEAMVALYPWTRKLYLGN